jgi:hypothetical protein
MIAQVTATIEDGALKLDQALPFPEHTRVKVTVQPVEAVVENSSLAAWERLLRMMDEKPLHGLAGKFSREALHELD